MDVILFIGFHVGMMSLFFVIGIYLFSQVDDKRKRQEVDRLRGAVPIAELEIDEAELRELVRAERYEDAVERLVTMAEVDRFTAQSAVESLKKQEYRPYYTSSDTYDR